MTDPRQPRFIQHHEPDNVAGQAEVIAGLLARQPHASPKFFYDSLGSRLFEAITELPEYYPTRTEAAIFEAHGRSMANAVGEGATLIDLGAGNCAKAASLFPVLKPARYVAVDISADFLRDALQRVQGEYPELEVTGLGADFSSDLSLPKDVLSHRPVFFYPGSSIGNFTPLQASRFLTSVREQSASDGGLLIGVDLVKPTAVLEAAYDDALGVTGAFNRNLLRHLNRLIGSDFDPAAWRHVALFNSSSSRIEMHLEATGTTRVQWTGGQRTFIAGDRIHTENSYKYTTQSFEALLKEAGFRRLQHWTDSRGWFAVFWAQV